MKTLTVEVWKTEHVKRFPDAAHKRIYARKETITIRPITKGQQILDLIIKGVPLHSQGR